MTEKSKGYSYEAMIDSRLNDQMNENTKKSTDEIVAKIKAIIEEYARAIFKGAVSPVSFISVDREEIFEMTSVEDCQGDHGEE